MQLPTLAVDFDGVLQNGFDEPLPGARDGMRELSKHYRLVLFTARHDLDGVAVWLHQHNLSHYFATVTNRKPNAVAYLDDRGVRFTGWPQAVEDVRAAT